MLLVYPVEDGVVELAYMWLPTWIGMNPVLKKEVEMHMTAIFTGKGATLEEMHVAVIDYLCTRFTEIHGLRSYLEAVEKVRGPDGPEG